jgi:hypothetical protein
MGPIHGDGDGDGEEWGATSNEQTNTTEGEGGLADVHGGGECSVQCAKEQRRKKNSTRK